MDLQKIYSNLPESIKKDGCANELKLLTIFSYYFYNEGNEETATDILNGITFNRANSNLIDGVFLNDNLDEDAVELVSTIYVDKNNSIEISEITNAIFRIGGIIKDYKEHNLSNIDKQAKNRIDEIIDENDIDKIALRIITNYDPNLVDKNNISDQISYLKKMFTCFSDINIDYGKDIEQYIRDCTEPFESVPQSSFLIDKPNHILDYNSNSFICNISAASIRSNWEKFGKRILAMNLRFYVKNDAIDKKIKDTVLNHSENFWYYNNGIIIICDDYKIEGNELLLKKFSIINGGQTTYLLGNIPFNNDFYVVAKIIKNTDQNKNQFIADVAEASNTQKPIKIKDVIANRAEQRELKTEFSKIGMFIEVKRGEKPTANRKWANYEKTKNNEVAQDLYSFVFLRPGSARNNISKLLQNDQSYSLIFKQNKYSIEFLKDIIWLEKSLREYQKKVSKGKIALDLTTQKILKNGLFYGIATIGYLLKLIYNPEYKNEIKKAIYNQDKLKDLFAIKGFDNHFIKEDNYKDFEKNIFELYSWVYTKCITPYYQILIGARPNLTAANFTKVNVHFEHIIGDIINDKIFNGDANILDFVKKFFKEITLDEQNSNIDSFVDKLKEESKDQANLNEIDVALDNDTSKENDSLIVDEDTSEELNSIQDELKKYRETKAKEENKKEVFILTDDQIDKIAEYKPNSLVALRNLIGESKAKAFGNDIVAIVEKYSD